MAKLTKKIAAGETELQQHYQLHVKRLREAERRMRICNQEAVNHENDILAARAVIEQCKRRAAEQGFPDLFPLNLK